MMSERIITTDEFTGAVHAVLTKRGDNFEYMQLDHDDHGGNTCVYSEDDGETGSCLFGAALIDELELEYDPCWEGATIAQILRGDVDPSLNFDVPTAVEVAAYEAQKLQDTGHRYGLVRESFDRILANPND